MNLIQTTSTPSKELCFKRERRLLTKYAYAQVFNHCDQQCFKYSNRYFQILTIDNNLDFARIGIICSKKQIKLAHERNRAKRLAREQFRLMQHELPTVDMVIMARKASQEITNLQLTVELTKALQLLVRYYSKRRSMTTNTSDPTNS